MKKILFVVDVYNLIYRMFYAIPEMHTREGIQVNAIFGVAKFLKSLSEENPNATIVIATDTGKTFRQEIFPKYKGTRDKMPDNLRSQIDGVFSLFQSAQIQIIGKEGYEADDIMGTIAIQYGKEEYQVIIISSDKDLCQFVRDDCVHIYDAMKRKFMKRDDVIKKFGVLPEQVCDYLAIVGDSSDNIPGIAGFGPKKTADLLKKYNSLDGIYENLEQCTPKMKESLENEKEKAYLSQRLATIDTDVEIEEIMEIPCGEQINNEAYVEILKQYEFKSLLPQGVTITQDKPNIDPQKIESQSEFDELLEKIIYSDEYIGLHIQKNKIFLSFQRKVYVLEYTSIDIENFISEIEKGKINISAYDFKDTLNNLYNFQRIVEVEKIQKSLFFNDI